MSFFPCHLLVVIAIWVSTIHDYQDSFNPFHSPSSPENIPVISCNFNLSFLSHLYYCLSPKQEHIPVIGCLCNPGIHSQHASSPPPLKQEHIPVIGCLCNPGIRARHWKQMSDIANFDLTPDSGTTLRKLLKLRLAPYMDQFEVISAAATKVS